MNININISQGIKTLKYADVNIIIDVIRAFTVSYYAIKNNIKEIILVANDEEAFKERKITPNSLIAGEKDGYKIEGFNFGNSPYDISKTNLTDKTLIQKTTNGVAATLKSMNAKEVFVTGYTNGYKLSQYIKKLIKNSNKNQFNINIVASHPTGDDDLACAEYIKSLILKDDIKLKELDKEAIYRILNSQAAEKFLDINNNDFYINDLIMTTTIEDNDFIMNVIKEDNKIKIKKRVINV